MEDLQAKVKSERSVLEKIMGYVPLYHGYKEKELRRESDKILRNFIFQNLDESTQNLKKTQTELVDSDKMKFAGLVDKTITKCDTISQRINHAESGYSGFWDATKIKEDDLDKLYELDEGIAELSLGTKESTKEFLTSSKSIESENTFNPLENKITYNLERIEDQLSKRHALLHGYGEMNG
jgi:hypothetical protein